jgi:FtsP/CotA-like multicopper oxidase with cupredoxin domain
VPVPHRMDGVPFTTQPPIKPGQSFTVEATELGVWAFRCRVRSHAEGPQGMFAMVTALIIQE